MQDIEHEECGGGAGGQLMCNETETAVCSCTHNMDSIHPWIYI